MSEHISAQPETETFSAVVTLDPESQHSLQDYVTKQVGVYTAALYLQRQAAELAPYWKKESYGIAGTGSDILSADFVLNLSEALTDSNEILELYDIGITQPVQMESGHEVAQQLTGHFLLDAIALTSGKIIISNIVEDHATGEQQKGISFIMDPELQAQEVEVFLRNDDKELDLYRYTVQKLLSA